MRKAANKEAKLSARCSRFEMETNFHVEATSNYFKEIELSKRTAQCMGRRPL